MKRIISVFLLLALLILTFSGCSDNNEKASISVDIFEVETSYNSTHAKDSSSKTTTSKSTKNVSKTVNTTSKNIISNKTENSKAQSSKATSNKSTSSKGQSSQSTSGKAQISQSTSNKSTSGKATSSKAQNSNSQSSKTLSNIKVTQKILFTSKKNSDKVKTTGRVAFESDYGLSMFWNGSSIEMNLDCEGEIIVRLSSTVGSASRIKIYVDGLLYDGDITTVSGITDITVATGLEDGIHNLKLVRSDDCDKGRVSLNYVELTGDLGEKPENKKLYIKVFGGSSVTGCGNLLSDEWFENEYQQSTARDTKNQDGTLAYPMVAAGLLDADISIIGRQGAGVTLTWHASDEQGLLKNLYSITAPSLNTAYTQTRKADVILIDDGEININPSLYSKNNLTYADIIKRAMSFLNLLRTDHPSAKIIWCYGIDHNCERKLYPEGSGSIATSSEDFVKDVISQMGSEAMGFYNLKLDYNPKRKGYPSISEHNAAGIKVAEKIQEILK